MTSSAQHGRLRTDTWSPSNFVVMGQATSSEEIRSALELFRADIEAKDCLLVTFRGGKVLRSLSFATEISSVGTQLRDLIRSGHSMNVSAEPIVNLINRRDQFFEFLCQQPDWRPVLNTGGSITYFMPPVARGSDCTTVCVLAFDVGKVVDEFISFGALETLELMVNTTPNSDVAIDISLTTGIRKIGRDLPLVGQVLIDDSDVDKLLTITRDALNAESIAVYERSRDGTMQTLVRSTRSKYLEPVQHFEYDNQHLVNAIATSQRRPVFYAPGQVGLSARALGDAPTELHSGWSAKSASVAVTELAVPIPSSPLGRYGASYGVVNVSRIAVDGRPGYFSKYDLAVVRNLALRLGFIGFVNGSSAAQYGITKLIAGTNSPLQPTTPAIGNFPFTELIGACEGFPADLYLARRQLQELVEALALRTAATSCTFRLLLPGDGLHRRKPELGLCRFAAWPEGRLRDKSPVLQLDSASVHAWVARTGSPCYLPDIRQRSVLRRYSGLKAPHRLREDTRAELCLPVSVDGRLVGTINLESAVPDAFGIHLSIASVYAAAASQVISGVRAEIAETTLSFSSDIYNSAHEILQSLDRISILLDEYSDDGSSELSEEVESIESILDREQSASDTPFQSVNGISVFDIVQHSLSEMNLGAVTIDNVLKMSGMRVQRDNAPKIADALSDVLAGVQTHMSRIDHQAIITAKRQTIAGRRYVEIVISYLMSSPVPASLAEHLYRVPLYQDVADAGRPHLGSYTAGAILRGIGGELYFRVTGRKRVEISVSLPLTEV